MDTAVSGPGLLLDTYLTINQQGFIEQMEQAEASQWPELGQRQSGDHIHTLFPELLPRIQRELPQQGADSGPCCFIEPLGEQLVIINVTKADDRTKGYALRVYPDSIGLGRVHRRQRHLELISQSLYESSLDAIITIDGDGIIREFSSSAEALFGYRREEVVGENVADIIIPPDLRQAHHTGMAHFHASGEGPVLNNRVEVRAMRRDGSIFPCELTVVPSAPFNNEIFFTATVRDISERHAREAALQKAREIAEASNKAKTQFLAHMSHEIRSPMNAVLGCMDLLLDSGINAEQQSLVETSLGAGSGLLGIIDDILDFSKIEAGEFKAHIGELQLAELCEQVADVIAVRASNKDIDIAAVIDPAIPNTVLSDVSFIRRILTNLLDNAVKFTHSGGVSLCATLGTVEEGDQHIDIIFEVRDSGIGIAEDKQQLLFREFSQVDSSDTTDYGGTGLGLAICKRLIEQLDGHIHLHSREGEGCLFRIVLPFALPKPISSQTQPLAGGPLAVVSSNPSFIQAIRRQAELWAWPCHCVARIDELPEAEAALYIIDISQALAAPQVLARQCRERGLNNDRIVLYASAFSTDSVLSATSVGFSHIMHRPLKPSSLLAFTSQGNRAGKASHAGLAPAAHSEPSRDVKLLLAEDNKANQLVAKTMLERAGYQLDIVDNGRLAVEAAATGDYSLILMDLRMPDLDGIEACKRIRAMGEPAAAIPIIAMTANAFESDVERCLNAGMNDFIAKPVDRQRLLSSLQKWLNDQDTAPQDEPLSEGADSAAVMDMAIAQQLLDDTSTEAVITIMTMVLDELAKLSNSLAALDGSTNSVSALREVAHASKSSAGYCGAVQLQNFCQQLELACELLDHNQLQALQKIAGQRIGDARTAITNYIADLA